MGIGGCFESEISNSHHFVVSMVHNTKKAEGALNESVDIEALRESDKGVAQAFGWQTKHARALGIPPGQLGARPVVVGAARSCSRQPCERQ